MHLLYLFIFKSGRNWWGKIAAATLIGGLMAWWNFNDRAESDSASNLPWFLIGAGMGLAASTILAMDDYRRRRPVDEAQGKGTGEEVGWSIWFSVLGAVVLIVLLVLALIETV